MRELSETFFSVGEIKQGLVEFADKDWPIQTAALQVTTDGSYRLTIPYFIGDLPYLDPRNEHARHLSRHGTALGTLSFVIPNGPTLTLTDCIVTNDRYGFMLRSVTHLSILVGNIVLHEYDDDENSKLLVKEIECNIDGLFAWTQIRGFSTASASSHSEISLSLQPERIEYQIEEDGFSGNLHIRGNYSRESAEDSISLVQRPHLGIAFEDARTIDSMLDTARVVADLLSLIFGIYCPLKAVDVLDDGFQMKVLSGDSVGRANARLENKRLRQEQLRPTPPNTAFSKPIVQFADVELAGLSKWIRKEAYWDRAFSPAVMALSGDVADWKSKALWLYIGFEAAGYRMEEAPSEGQTYSEAGHATNATRFFRVIHHLGIDWEQVGLDPFALSTAISNNYNAIKHPRSYQVDEWQSRLLSSLVLYCLRHLSLTVVSSNTAILEARAVQMTNEIKDWRERNSLDVEFVSKDRKKAVLVTEKDDARNDDDTMEARFSVTELFQKHYAGGLNPTLHNDEDA